MDDSRLSSLEESSEAGEIGDAISDRDHLISMAAVLVRHLLLPRRFYRLCLCLLRCRLFFLTSRGHSNGRCDRRGKLGPRGMAAVCAALSAVCHTDDARVIFGEHLPFVRKMFLHFNDLDDAAVSTLADFLEGQAVCAGGGADKGFKGMLRELHLSDNKISHRGAVRLVSAAKKSREAMGVKPLWLRLENQKSADRIVRDRLSAAVSGAPTVGYAPGLV